MGELKQKNVDGLNFYRDFILDVTNTHKGGSGISSKIQDTVDALKDTSTKATTTNNKRTLKGGWGVTFNPIAIGMYPANSSFKFGWTPNVGVGYYLTFK